MSQNHYQVLGVARTAPLADIKRAYRQLVVRYHPDKHGGDARYEDQFKAVAVAYGVLSDPGRRASYDFELQQLARRADDLRRRQQHRPATQHVYGVPMPPPAPLRTRPPAGSRERHYMPRQRVRFTRRDWLLSLLIFAGIILFGVAVKVTMDRVSARSAYEDGLRAYAHGQWPAAYSFMDDALNFRPSYGAALRRRAELEQLMNHNPAAARADFQAALLLPQSPRVAADMLYRLGRCQAALNQPAAAELSYCRALMLDSALSAAYLARGEGRLLDLHQPKPALADLNKGLAQRRRQGLAPRWHFEQVRGVALVTLGRYDEARDSYRRVLEALPQDGRTHFLLGKLAQRTGDQASACEFYRRALVLGYSYAGTAWEENCE